MRQIGTLGDEALAHRLADYLRTLQIEVRLQREPEGWAIWVCDEDKVADARGQMTTFQSNPNDKRYIEATSTARALRRQEEEEEQSYQKKQEKVRDSLTRGPVQRRITFALIAISVIVTLDTKMGEDTSSLLMQTFSIAPFRSAGGNLITWNGLDSIMKGEVWRLITPIFLHFSPTHLLFNMLMLFDLGGLIETRRGPWRFLALVLITAILSNLAEYYISLSFQIPTLVQYRPSPLFGGMSGVLYGLFGYAWMKTRYQPELELFLSPVTVLLLLGWLVICMTGQMGAVANMAHLVGLLVGVVIGFLPVLWRSLRGGSSPFSQ